MKSVVEKMRAKADEAMAEHEVAAAAHVTEVFRAGSEAGERKWKDATVKDRLAVAYGAMVAARQRARINANAGPKVFGLVVMPQRIEDPKEWEAKARQVGARVIDTTAGPAALAEEKKP